VVSPINARLRKKTITAAYMPRKRRVKMPVRKPTKAAGKIPTNMPIQGDMPNLGERLLFKKTDFS
jgi:hypothetical protein